MRMIGLAAAALAVTWLGCSSSTSPSSSGGGHTTSVSLQNTAFNPSPDTVAVNATVTWTNNDGFTHNVTYASGPGTTFASSGLAGGGTYSHQFTQAGTYVIYCTIHGTPSSGMRMTLVVQ